MSTLSTPTVSLEHASQSAVRKTSPTVALAFGLTLLAFWPTLVSFPSAWVNRGGQGFVVAVFCGYLAWKARERLMAPDEPMPMVSALLFGLSMLWLVAFVLNVQVVHQAIVPLMLLLWLLAVLGWTSFKTALPVAATFFLAVPIWGVLIRPLQTMTVAANSVLLRLSGITAEIRGDHIEIPSGLFWVASGCAGLNYFETALLVGVMYSLLFLHTWKARAVAVAIALSLALVSNWLRVFGLIVVGHVTEMKSPLIAEHGLYGWLIFGATMVIFFMLTKRVEAFDARLSSAAADASPSSSSASTSTIAARRSTARPLQVTTPLVALATATAILGPILYFGLGGSTTTERAPERAIGLMPDSQWSRTETTTGAGFATTVDMRVADSLQGWVPRFFGADEHRVERWAADSAQVRVDRLLYATQGQGKELINSENRITTPARSAGEQLVGPLDQNGRMLTATIVRTGEQARLVWHWYNVAGVNTHSGIEAKMLELVAFARSDAPPSELVTVSAPCGVNDCQEAARTLFRFVLGQDIPAESAPEASGIRR